MGFDWLALLDDPAALARLDRMPLRRPIDYLQMATRCGDLQSVFRLVYRQRITARTMITALVCLERLQRADADDADARAIVSLVFVNYPCIYSKLDIWA